MATARVHVSIIPDKGGIVVYDLHAGRILHSITDYLVFLSYKLAKNWSTVEQAGWRISRFYSFLLLNGQSILDIDDATLVEYRSRELTLVKKDRSFRGSDRAVRSTVNQKLSAILNWIAWMQSLGLVSQFTIGPSNARVTASSVGRHRMGLAPIPGDAISSPLYLSGAGDAGSGPFVSESIYRAALEHIVRTAKSDYKAQRDSLFLDVSRYAGFRRGSTHSLTIDQFCQDLLLRWQEDTFSVTPKVQKLGYENSFEIPTDLALRVSDFIEGPRRALVKRLGVGVSITRDQVFLSMRTGRPVSARSMTSALRPAMRAAGGKKGKVIHAIRGLFASNVVLDEAIHRRDAGLDTSTVSIALATAWKLGQKDPDSMVPYVAQELSNIARRSLAKRRRDEE
ncbi:hypothetical protein [Pelomonas sp. SE-A7]|uniref:hypothetical protein n=1 Tax=Pelomonas sp. SE-A7 TaxID=3054953 RepID=UPI00259CC909|nr:hypothetical protein [Pelomonas sp. SE-A7]MDM4768260.1 hypothetical protein [Pelomonas sp. SE-A7]